MSRTAWKLASVLLGVGCVVVIVRAQDRESALRTPTEAASTSGGEPTPAAPRMNEYRPRGVEPAPTRPTADAPSETTSSASSAKRLSAAERLQQVRDGNRGSAQRASAKGTTVQGPVTSDPTGARQPRVAEQPTSPGLIAPSRTGKSLSTVDSDSESASSVLKKQPEAEAPSSDRQTARRLLRPSRQNSTAVPKTTIQEPSPSASAPSASAPSISAPSISAPSTTTPPVNPLSASPKSGRTEEVIRSRGPTLRVETTGPTALKLGSEATYTIHVYNDGDVAANEIFIRAGLPVSAKAIAEGSSAESSQASDSPNEQRFVWTIPQLAARGSEKLILRVTPTTSEFISLFVDWTLRPVSAVAQIEVQQPQLEMSVFGPKDIAYGEAAKYTIRLSNPGNGDADNVSVEFGYGQEKLEPKNVGTLSAGQQQEISLELTARQSGALPVVAIATASGGLRAEASQEVLVRRAALEADVTGDAAVFAGSPSNYRVVIRNAGNASANQVTATVSLPQGAQLARGSDEAQPIQNGLLWNLGILPPNSERTLDIQATLSTAGDNAVSVRVNGAGDLEAAASFVTRVEALADLKLTVNDPQGPVAVGHDCVYEIHIVNRGTKAATKINVVAQFSPGIEPVDATGVPAEIVPGQVLFQPIPRIDPGQEITLIVRSKADSQGPKRFRAEVSCDELDTQLVAQETTHFFADSSNKTSKAKSSPKR